MRYNGATMSIFLSILAVGLYLGSILLLAVRPHGSQLTRYELERRVHQGDAAARHLLRRVQFAGAIEGVRQLGMIILAVGVVGFLSAAIGWWGALLIGLLWLALAPLLARLGMVRSFAQRVYDRSETKLLTTFAARPWLAAWVRVDYAASTLHIGSREELAHLIDQAGAHLSHDQQKLLLHSLKFDERTVGDVMTRKGEIDTIDRRELLGPLVLDDLHKTGHSVFPVTDGGIDQVVGVLSIAGFLSLDSKRSITAEKAMTPHVERISETASLRAAMQQFVRSHQHLLIVVNDERETVGVVSLHDVMTALFGR